MSILKVIRNFKFFNARNKKAELENEDLSEFNKGYGAAMYEWFNRGDISSITRDLESFNALTLPYKHGVLAAKHRVRSNFGYYDNYDEYLQYIENIEPVDPPMPVDPENENIEVNTQISITDMYSKPRELPTECAKHVELGKATRKIKMRKQ